jgi:hypothetical protein
MKVLTRISFLVPLMAWFGLESCVTDNPAAYTGILGETRPPPIDPTSSGGVGGTTSNTVTTGAVSTTSVAGAAGASAGAGGEASESTTTDGGTGTPFECVKDVDERYAPRCCEYETLLGEEAKKGNQCTNGVDPSPCYRECGPASSGWKEEKCQAGVYAEENCVFPPEVDYSCYAIPEEIDEALCGLEGAEEAPQATNPCEAPECTLCNVEGRYLDTAGDSKEGWCVCRPADENGIRTWTCASDTAWPCPLGLGC